MKGILSVDWLECAMVCYTLWRRLQPSWGDTSLSTEPILASTLNRDIRDTDINAFKHIDLSKWIIQDREYIYSFEVRIDVC